MNVASIDIGTNTILLLITEVDEGSERLRPLVNEYRMPRIGRGTSDTGIITPDKLELLFDVIHQYDSIIKEYKCDKVLITGTNALRIARNTNEITTRLKNYFNYDLDVVTGDVEAEYAYLGAVSILENFKSSLVIDIGGGSTELIFGNELSIYFKASLQIGSVSTTEQFLKHSPPLKWELEKLRDSIHKMLINIVNREIPENVIAVAGTATTLGCINLELNEFDEKRIEKSVIRKDELNEMINKISELIPEEILKNYGPVMKGREDIILAGAIILFEILKTLGIEKVLVSSRGIRYGAIINYLNKLK